jgi:hypothetical protein
MRSIRQSTRDFWEFKLFVIGIIWIALGYGLFSVTIPVLPQPKRVDPNAWLLIPALFSLTTALLLWVLARALWPIVYDCTILEDRILLSESTKHKGEQTILRASVRQFYTQKRRFYHVENANMPVVCEYVDGSKQKLDLKFVSPDSRSRFYEYVAEAWGTGYVPAPKPPGILSTKLTWPWRSRK